jgi:hypothetical protein
MVAEPKPETPRTKKAKNTTTPTTAAAAGLNSPTLSPPGQAGCLPHDGGVLVCVNYNVGLLASGRSTATVCF